MDDTHTVGPRPAERADRPGLAAHHAGWFDLQRAVARLLASVSVLLSVIIGLLALLCTAGLGYVAIRRFRLNNAAVHQEEALGDGKVNALTSLLVVLTAIGGLLYVVVVT